MKWIDCENKLPDITEYVMVCDCKNKFVSFGCLLKNGHFAVEQLPGFDEIFYTTHWMDIPDFPDSEA